MFCGVASGFCYLLICLALTFSTSPPEVETKPLSLVTPMWLPSSLSLSSSSGATLTYSITALDSNSSQTSVTVGYSIKLVVLLLAH